MSGLEVISSIASIAQLAGNVYAISKTLYEVGNALSNAPSDIQDLARDLETFSEELRLLSTFLDQKKGYADQIHKLTAKIIGDCAKICIKIDRILQKLRNGRVWARVKWLYKEKEIKRLLARLRDLKLCLMGTLSFMNILKADAIMDTINVPSRSLLEDKGESMSAETLAQLEGTRSQLSKVSIASKIFGEGRPQEQLKHARQDVSQVKMVSKDNNFRPDPDEIHETVSLDNAPQVGARSTWQVSRPKQTISSQSPNQIRSQISMFDPGKSPVSSQSRGLLGPAKMFSGSSIVATTQFPNTSVETFHSARSQFDPGLELGNESRTDNSAPPVQRDTSITPRNTECVTENPTPSLNPHLALKTDMVSSVIRHFQMSQEEAEAWAAKSIPKINQSSELDSRPRSHDLLNLKSDSRTLSEEPPLPARLEAKLPRRFSPMEVFVRRQCASQGSTNDEQENLRRASRMRRKEFVSWNDLEIDDNTINSMASISQAGGAAHGPNANFDPSPPLNTSNDQAQPSKNVDSDHGNNVTNQSSIIPVIQPGLDTPMMDPPKPTQPQITSPLYMPPPRMDSITAPQPYPGEDFPLFPLQTPPQSNSISIDDEDNRSLSEAKYDFSFDNYKHFPQDSGLHKSQTPSSYHKMLLSNANIDNRHELKIQALSVTTQNVNLPGDDSDDGDSLTPAQSRRKAQNRAAQRAFHELKSSHVKDLQAKLFNLEKSTSSVEEENERLKVRLQKTIAENEILKASPYDLNRRSHEPLRNDKTMRVFQPGGDSSSEDLGPLDPGTSIRSTSDESEDAIRARELRQIIEQKNPIPMGRSSQRIMPDTMEEKTTKCGLGDDDDDDDDMTPVQSRRKAQNGAAQQLFRERKERHIKDLEVKLANLEIIISTNRNENERLKLQLQKKVTETEISRLLSSDKGDMGTEDISLQMQLPKLLTENENFTPASATQNLLTDLSSEALPAHESRAPSDTNSCEQTFWSLQSTDLWRKAFEKLLPDFSSSETFMEMWYEVYCSCEPAPSTDRDVARRAAAIVEIGLVKASKSLIAVVRNEYAEVLQKSLHRIEQILDVVRSTLDFKTGGFIWTCLCKITSSLLAVDLDYQTGSTIFTKLADLATLIARYNVIESIFRQWPNMTIEKKYEDSILSVCMTVLQYLGSIKHAELSLPTEPPPRASFSSTILRGLADWQMKTLSADAACRGFKFIIEPGTVLRKTGFDRIFEETDDSEDDAMDDSAHEASGPQSILVKHDSGEDYREDFRSMKRLKVCH